MHPVHFHITFSILEEYYVYEGFFVQIAFFRIKFEYLNCEGYYTSWKHQIWNIPAVSIIHH